METKRKKIILHCLLCKHTQVYDKKITQICPKCKTQTMIATLNNNILAVGTHGMIKRVISV